MENFLIFLQISKDEVKELSHSIDFLPQSTLVYFCQ